MALDKIINDHIDKQEALEEGLAKDIDVAINNLSIDELMEEPAEALVQLVEGIKNQLIDKYAEQAIKNGQEFSNIVTKLKKTGKDIEVQDTDDPMINKEEDKDAEKD